MLFFFFSSRRRHTRLQGDWSSDVCSSDLERLPVQSATQQALGSRARHHQPRLLLVEKLLLQSCFGTRRREAEIGRASCRERAWNSAVGVTGEKDEGENA